MLYNIFLANNAYLCNVKRKKVQDNKMFNRSRNAGAQTKTIMEKNVNEILMLRYPEAACPASLGFVKKIKY